MALTILGGGGFVGGAYVNAFYDAAVGNVASVNLRNDYDIYSSDVLYFISTVHNYNVFDHPFLDIETNLTTLVRVLENWRHYQLGAQQNGVFNFISSWFVYGEQPFPHNVREDAECHPKGFYSITKRCAEELLISYCETFGLQYRILRLGNVVGDGDHKTSAKKNALQYMLGRLKSGEPVEIYGNGDQFRDYIHTKDCVRAIETAITSGRLQEIYNIGNGCVTWSLREIIEFAAKELNSRSEITFIAPKTFHSKVQVHSFYMNVEKLRLLGFTPEFTGEKLFRSLL